jgi:hypothetical protein
MTERWPFIFNKAKDFKMLKEVKRDFLFNYKERKWI